MCSQSTCLYFVVIDKHFNDSHSTAPGKLEVISDVTSRIDMAYDVHLD